MGIWTNSIGTSAANEAKKSAANKTETLLFRRKHSQKWVSTVLFAANRSSINSPTLLAQKTRAISLRNKMPTKITCEPGTLSFLSLVGRLLLLARKLSK